MHDMLKQLVQSFYPFAKKRLGFKKPVSLFFKPDFRNAQNPLGKTAYYDPEAFSITVYTAGRHPKDILRSFSHELVHHAQNCRGEFDEGLMGEAGPGYAQSNEHLREMEREAYEEGNLCFRDWEDGIKTNTLTLKVMTEACQKAEKELIKEQGETAMSKKNDIDIIKQTIQEVLMEQQKEEEKWSPDEKKSGEALKKAEKERVAGAEKTLGMTDDSKEKKAKEKATAGSGAVKVTKEELEEAIQAAIKEAVNTIPPLNPEADAMRDVAAEVEIEEPANTPPPVMAEEEDSLQEKFDIKALIDETIQAALSEQESVVKRGPVFTNPEGKVVGIESEKDKQSRPYSPKSRVAASDGEENVVKRGPVFTNPEGKVVGIESEKDKQSRPYSPKPRVAASGTVREEVEGLEEKTKKDSPDRAPAGHPEDRLKPLEEEVIEEEAVEETADSGALYEEAENETLEEWKNRTMYENMLKRFKIGS